MPNPSSGVRKGNDGIMGRNPSDKPVTLSELEQAIGPEVVETLSPQTGFSKQELLARLCRRELRTSLISTHRGAGQLYHHICHGPVILIRHCPDNLENRVAGSSPCQEDWWAEHHWEGYYE